MFVYEGPATIGGVHFDEVSLREQRDRFAVDDHQRWWEGTAVIPPSAAPPLFGLPDTPALQVELPNGSKGTLCASASFCDGRWTLDIRGEGPPPGHAS